MIKKIEDLYGLLALTILEFDARRKSGVDTSW